MNWNERFKAMKNGMNYTNNDIAEITGNTVDSIKTATQPNNEIPRWVKLAIVVYEESQKIKQMNITKDQPKEEVLMFIRSRLKFNDDVVAQMRHINPVEFEREHRRFDMSGYDGATGDCTVKNQNILNEFAALGIYDYTEYLFLDFYKGTPTLYLKYWGDDQNIEESFTGLGTTEIIYEVFQRTIFSERGTRRRH